LRKKKLLPPGQLHIQLTTKTRGGVAKDLEGALLKERPKQGANRQLNGVKKETPRNGHAAGKDIN